MSNIPQNLKYTAEHEWVATGDAEVVRVGITDHAQDALGDIVFVNLPSVGDTVSAGGACGEVESTKSVSDLYAPVTGTVTAVNEAVVTSPETINADAYGAGWLFEVTVSEASTLDSLLDAGAYAALLGE
jgi:glycine cleavage system H protein